MPWLGSSEVISKKYSPSSSQGDKIALQELRVTCVVYTKMSIHLKSQQKVWILTLPLWNLVNIQPYSTSLWLMIVTYVQSLNFAKINLIYRWLWKQVLQESKSSLRVYYQLFQLYTVIKSKIQCSPEATETGIFTGYFFQKLQQNNVKYLLRSEINFHVALFLFTCILKKIY